MRKRHASQYANFGSLLYGQPGYEKITEDLKAELVKLQTQYKDPIEEKLR
ncbi:hypothetical protein H6A58_15355 [Phocaeicola coprocola]|nr:hypothetical protein [Phocaeicola coprocola]MBM6904449.1 hypothetical protein [Phocaeicola coprocola]